MPDQVSTGPIFSAGGFLFGSSCFRLSVAARVSGLHREISASGAKQARGRKIGVACFRLGHTRPMKHRGDEAGRCCPGTAGSLGPPLVEKDTAQLPGQSIIREDDSLPSHPRFLSLPSIGSVFSVFTTHSFLSGLLASPSHSFLDTQASGKHNSNHYSPYDSGLLASPIPSITPSLSPWTTVQLVAVFHFHQPTPPHNQTSRAVCQ